VSILGRIWHNANVIGRERQDLHRKAVGATVRELRTRQGLSQEKLSEKLGVDQRQVARIEAGRVPATLELIEKLAEVLHTSSFVFLSSTAFGGENELLSVDEFRQWALRAITERFLRQLDRQKVADLVFRTAELTDQQLAVLWQVADAFASAPRAA
jgi:transcriptional regulator with XRE-family HTH domain